MAIIYTKNLYLFRWSMLYGNKTYGLRTKSWSCSVSLFLHVYPSLTARGKHLWLNQIWRSLYDMFSDLNHLIPPGPQYSSAHKLHNLLSAVFVCLSPFIRVNLLHFLPMRPCIEWHMPPFGSRLRGAGRVLVFKRWTNGKGKQVPRTTLNFPPPLDGRSIVRWH